MFTSSFLSLRPDCYNVLSLIELLVSLATLSGTGTHRCSSPSPFRSWPCLSFRWTRSTALLSLSTVPPPTPGFSSKRFLTTKQPVPKDKSSCAKTKCHQFCLLSTLFFYFKSNSQSARTFKIQGTCREHKECWHHNPCLKEAWGRRARTCLEGLNKKGRLNVHKKVAECYEKNTQLREYCVSGKGSIWERPWKMEISIDGDWKTGHEHMHGNGDKLSCKVSSGQGQRLQWRTCRETGWWPWDSPNCLNNKARCLYIF